MPQEEAYELMLHVEYMQKYLFAEQISDILFIIKHSKQRFA